MNATVTCKCHGVMEPHKRGTNERENREKDCDLQRTSSSLFFITLVQVRINSINITMKLQQDC